MNKKYITIREVCELTGLSRQSIYAEIYKARVMGFGIPFTKFGTTSLRFEIEKIQDWMEHRKETFVSMKVVLEKRKANWYINKTKNE